MVKNREINGTEEIGLVTPTPGPVFTVVRLFTLAGFLYFISFPNLGCFTTTAVELVLNDRDSTGE